MTLFALCSGARVVVVLGDRDRRFGFLLKAPPPIPLLCIGASSGNARSAVNCATMASSRGVERRSPSAVTVGILTGTIAREGGLDHPTFRAIMRLSQ